MCRHHHRNPGRLGVERHELEVEGYVLVVKVRIRVRMRDEGEMHSNPKSKT